MIDGTRSLVHQLKIPLINKLLSFPTQSQKGKELHRVAAISGTIFAAFGIFKRSFLTYLHALLEVKWQEHWVFTHHLFMIIFDIPNNEVEEEFLQINDYYIYSYSLSSMVISFAWNKNIDGYVISFLVLKLVRSCI